MEQMAGSEMKPPFSSLKGKKNKNKINWGRGGIICMKWPASSSQKVTLEDAEHDCSSEGGQRSTCY